MVSPQISQILAAGSLVAVASGLAAWAWAATRHLRLTPVQKAIYTVSYSVVRVLWRGKTVGRLTIPHGQGAVIVCNHRGPLDGTAIAASTNRLVHWMVAREYSSPPVIRTLFRICGGIPVNRGGIDTAATKLAIRYAREGGLVGLFPEGRINTTDAVVAPGRPGAAMIALKAGVPIVPCFISGSPYDGTVWGCLLMPAKVRLTIGRPIDLSEYRGKENSREVLEEVTRRLLAEIARLAGCDDFEPKLAGRFYKPGLAEG